MSERDEILAAELIAQRLRDPKFQEKVAVSRNRDTGNEDELIQDMRNLNDLEIRAKYGDEGYLASMGQYYTSNEVDQINDRERTTREKWSDIATSAVMAPIRSGGNLSGIGAGFLVEKMTDSQISREQATAEILSAHNQAVEGVLQENLSETIQDRQRLFQIEGELDSFDNYVEYERDLAEGANPMLAEWRMEGKNFIDSASRALNSGDVTAQLIAEGVGDMALTAPLGGAAGLVVKGLGRTALSRALTTRVGRVMGRVGKAGAYASGDVALEVSGVYAETVQDVMAKDNSTLLETSSIYRGLIQEGHSPSEAKAILAGMAAETAAIRQAPASVALSFLTSKFEAMPIGSFRNSGIAGGLLTMAGEGIEEAGQGISGKINQNIAVEEYANIDRRTLEGAGEEAALGAIAGIGTAGVFATPSAPRNVLSDAGKARDALLDFALDGATEYNDPLRQNIMGRDSRAQEAARAATALAVDFGTNVGRGAAAFAGDALKAGEAVGLDKAARATVDAARGATQTAVNTTAEVVNRVNTRDERAQTSKEVEEAVAAARTVDEEIQAGQVTPEVAQSVSNEGTAPTPNLSDTVGSNKIETVANIMAKVGSRTFKPTVEDKAFAAAQIKSLAGVMNSLPEKARRQVAKLVTSKAAQNVVKEAGEIDLNKEEVSPEAEVSTTVNVAKSNPANVNPEKTKKILEESGETISPEDVKYLRVASKVASTINNLVGNLVSIREDENIGLRVDGQAEKEKIDPTARSIYVDGYVNDKGEKLRSINDFASDIIQGAQSPDGTIINQKREVVPVRSVAESFNKMVQHMNNRIGALNQSFDSNTRNSRGKLTAGKGFPFQGLRNGETFVELTSPLYHRDNPASVALAKRIAAERDATVEIYEALQAEFPEIFDGLDLPDLIELKTEENQTQQPTGIEESFDAPASEATSTSENIDTDINVEDSIYDDETTNNIRLTAQDILDVAIEEGDHGNIGGIDLTNDRSGRIQTVKDVTNAILQGAKEAPKQTTRAQQILADYLFAVLSRELNEQNPTAVEEVSSSEEMIQWSGIGLYLSIFKDMNPFDFKVEEIAPNVGMYAFAYITGEGRRIAGTFDYNDYEQFIDSFVVTTEGGPNSIGIRDIRFLGKKLKGEFPNALGLAGDRLSGSRIVNANDDTPVSLIFDYVGDRLVLRKNQPTAVEEETNSEEGTDDEGAIATEETVSDEEIDSDEQALSEDEMSDEEIRDLMDTPSSWSEADRVRIQERQNRLAGAARQYVAEIMGDSLKKRIRQLRIYPDSLGFGPGYAYVSEDGTKKKIYLSEAMFDENDQLTAEGRAVLLHEAAHVVDFTNDPKWISQSNFFNKTGKIMKEWNALNPESDWAKGRMEYANSFRGSDDKQHRAEVFAVLTEFYYSKNESLLADSPEIVAEMEIIYGTKTQATGTSTDSTTSEGTSSETGGTTDTTEGSTFNAGLRPNSEFLNEVYPRDENTNAPANLNEVVQVIENNGGINTVTVNKIVELAPKLTNFINKRLRQRKTQIDGKTRSIHKHILENHQGLLAVMQYKFTALADPETGEMNQNMMELATVAMVDWLTSASQSDPNRFKDTLEKQGLSYADLKSDEQARDMAIGIPPSSLKPQLARAILDMWGVKPNKKSAMVDYYGIAEGLAAEMLLGLEAEGYLEVKRIELAKVMSSDAETGDKEVQHVKTDSIILNLEKVREFQNEVRSNRQDGVSNTVKEYFLGKSREMYSIGEKIPFKKRGRLSARENKAIRTMQDTPHFYNEELGNLMLEIGDENLMRILGFVEGVNEETVPNATLRRSILGKNLSIENNLTDAGILTSQLSRQDPVYYPVDVTSVGRHQYQGVNPQSNKFLRALVTPTWATVDIATQEDSVWLGVAQAADLHKIEKKNHAKILETVQDDFEARYGEAKNQVLNILRGDEFDSDAFTESVLGSETEIEPQVMAAIFTVAKMQHAKETGQTSFESSLSVELDGLTNGAANMMVNFAQGLMKASEWENFKKIGFYIGKVGQTINDYFEKEGNLDMYETVARLAQEKMVRAMTKGKMQREAVAAHRFASHFGDLKKNEKTGQFEMSRNSAKNPMTKVNYGSGVLGVGTGIADDMMMAFFMKLHEVIAVEGGTLADIEYNGDLATDLEVLGIRLPKDVKASWEPTRAELTAFRFNVSQTMGQALTEAAKETLGSRITEVNDLLVFSTNVQAAYLNEMFEKKMMELGERLANAGEIRRHEKTGKPVMRDIPVEEYDRVVAELERMAPIFTSDEQTLELGGFKIKIADSWPVLSAAMDGRLNQKPMLKQPDDVGVKAIPFIVIGTGDAMMMNLIFGSDGAPMDVLGVFDGLDVPVTKLQQYAPMVNQRVMETWDRDVLAMVVENFRGFLNSNLDQEALKRAFATAKDKSKKSTVTATSNEELIQQLDIRLQNNRAFKAMLKKVPVSVDQMGGSNIGFSRSEGSLGLNALNDIVRRELEGKSVQTVEEIDEVDVKNPVEETTVSAVIKGIRWSEQQKKVMDIIRPALGDTRVVFGTIDQLNVWRRENVPDDGLVMTAPAQYDPVNEILFLSNARPETILHELVHAGTFQKVLDHYNGQTNEAVIRLEGLMDDFMNIQDGGQKVREAQATIARYRQSTDPFAKAAAVNELMAYVLANDAVRKKAQTTQAQSLASIGSKVIRLMRRLLGGAPESIYDGVAFNTQMLIGTPIDDSAGDGGNGDGGGDNAGGEMTPPANNYTNYWIRLLGNYLNENTDTVTREVRRDEQVRARASVNQIVDSFRQVGMLQNQEARMTFKAIYGVINADIQLRSQPLISMNKMFDHIIENMTPEMFGDGQEAAQEYSAVLNAFGKDNDQINSISVLLALSQTSSKFRQVLDQIPEPETGATGTRLQNTLTAVATKIMDTITARVHENGDAKQVMDMLAATIIEYDQDREWFMLQKVTSSLDAADKYVGGRMQALAEFMRRTDRETRENSRSKVKKFLIGSVTIGTNYLDKTGSDLNNQGLKNQFHMGIPVLSIVPVRELISEIVGTDRFNQKVVALQDKVNHAISGMRQAYREDLPGILANLFQEKPTKTQWKAMYNVIAQTDFVSVIDPNNIAQGMQLLADPAVRSARIRQLETELDRKLVPYVSQDAKDKAEQLANYMTGGGVGTLLVRNAYAIAKNLDGEYDASLVPVLDELISIYAIDMMDADQRQEVLDLYASDQEAMEQIITYLQGLNEEEENKPNISEMARLNAYKGFIPNEGAKDTRIIVADDADELDLKLKGYVKLKPYTGDPSNVVDRSYYITNTRTAGMYAQGTMQNVASTYRGVDVNTGLSLGNDTTGFISGDGIVERTMEQLLDAAYVQENPQEGFMPVFAEGGTVMGFERSVNREIADKFLGREENLAIMMGAWAGRQLEETTAYQYNVALIDELDAIWQNRERGSENLFENMKETEDPIYAESFKLIPNNIKSYIDTKFDGQGLMIRKDMTNLAVGYREASLADMWSGKTRMPKEVQKTVQGVTQLFMGRNAMKWIVKVEDVGQGLISTAKDIIVIRSLVVPALNMQANVAQLVTNGVPLKTLKKSMQSKLAEVEQYNKNVTKIIELKAKIRLQARNANQKKILSDKIKAIEDLNKKMSIAPMIAAGAYKQLSEGITEFDENIMSGKLGDYVEAQVAKLPSGVRTIAEHGIVSKSTKIYQIANRATQYGDFLAKSIYYDHLLSQGLAPDVVVARINEEFVNFSTQPGRVRSALERNGLSWFMAFKLRIAKIAMRQLRDNPVRALAVNAVLDVGSPIEDNIFSVMAEGRLDYATGYEMLFAAPELNPWVNLLSD